MSGCGRKHRAKHLTNQFLDDDSWTAPANDESIVVCIDVASGNMFNVVDPLTYQPNTTTEPQHQTITLPRRFHKVIWIMRGDYLVVKEGEVTRKLTPVQVKRLLSEAPQYALPDGVVAAPSPQEAVEAAAEEEENDLLTMQNPNRGNHRRFQPSDNDDDDEDEEEEEEDEGEDEKL